MTERKKGNLRSDISLTADGVLSIVTGTVLHVLADQVAGPLKYVVRAGEVVEIAVGVARTLKGINETFEDLRSKN